MTDSSPEKRNWNSVRVILEGGILLGLVWLIGNSVQQSQDIAVIKTNSDYIAKNADKVPELMLRMQSVEDLSKRNEQRIGHLEALEKAK